MFGFINIYKPTEMTSHDVISVLRKITKIKQIGHTGTLDPFAQGVLPVCVGKATRLIEYLDSDKAYIGTFCFGKNTDTYDKDGKITEEFTKKVTDKDIVEKLKEFENETTQIPPIYSAIKVKGKKLYQYAREGKSVEIKPRKIFIEKIELKEFDFNKQTAEVYIKCSAGTYIRTLAYDLGKKLDCGCYLSELIRVQAGKFFVENSVKLEELKTAQDIETNLINPIEYLPLEKITLTEFEYQKVIHGMAITKNSPITGQKVALIYNSELVGIAKPDNETLSIEKVFKTE